MWQPVLEGNATVLLRTEVDTVDVLVDAPPDCAVDAMMRDRQNGAHP
ncbi:hypothetical protein ABZS81_19510 [Streptomyces sp. NPDC005318]